MTEPETEKVARCAGIPTQRATFNEIDATGRATEAQPQGLKALAGAVLSRNRRRNPNATDDEKSRNFYPEKMPERLREVAPENGPTSGLKFEDLTILARDIAAEFGVTAEQCLSFLDESDREAIRTGSDPERAEAWRAAVASLVRPTEALPGNGADTADLWVIVFTPNGRPLRLKACDAEHARWLQRVNPLPAEGQS